MQAIREANDTWLLSQFLLIYTWNQCFLDFFVPQKFFLGKSSLKLLPCKVYSEHLTWLSILDASRDLVPFIKLKERENHSWRSVTFSKPAGSTGVFHVFQIV